MIPGVPERRSHDYVRHGTIDLFAALNIADGTVISQLSAAHRAVEFREFLDADRPADRPAAWTSTWSATTMSAHKAPAVHRTGCSPIPASSCTSPRPYSSWMNQVPVNRPSARRHARAA